jgi:hypothetical protein
MGENRAAMAPATTTAVAWASDRMKQCKNQIDKFSWHLTLRSSSSISLFFVKLLVEQC